MPVVPLRAPTVHELLAVGFTAVREEAGVPERFPPEVEAAAEAMARRGPRPADRIDATDVPLVTIDPPGSMDLDQAVHVAPRPGGRGWDITYAIADPAAFIDAGDPVDAEAHRRGVTVYLPDRRAPLHPDVLGEGAASLLPDGDRPAVLWRIRIDGDGQRETVDVVRAVVRSRRRLTYDEVQGMLDAGTAPDDLVAFAAAGRALVEAERARGGVSLPIPDQIVVRAAGRYELVHRAPLPAEGWNAQVSLLTGMSAAALMVDAGVGILRTLPPAAPDAVATLRRAAHGLDVAWPADVPYGELVRSLDARIPVHAALLAAATRLFRGAGYAALDGDAVASAHAAVAAPYAHVTAPLRRLVDRYGSEVALAVAAGRPVPGWVTAALPALPATMRAARDREGVAARLAVDLVEAVVLGDRVGAVLDGVVLERSDRGPRVQLERPAVVALATGEAEPGTRVRVRVASADAARRRVELAIV